MKNEEISQKPYTNIITSIKKRVLLKFMRIVITGSEGFIGRELVRQLKAANFSVVGIELVKPANISLYEIFHNVDFQLPDISDVIPEGADAFIHLAALSSDPVCKNKPYECFNVNVMGTLNLMRVVASKNIKQFIFASSEWVYEKFVGEEEKDERSLIDITGHTSEYALSKLVSEANLREQYKQGFCATTILRFGIIYGPRKAPPAGGWSAVESLTSAVKNQPEVAIGSLKTGRRFVHVKDIARGIIKAIGLEGFEIINLSGDRLITLQEIIRESEKLFGKKVRIIEKTPSEISVRNPLNHKAKKLIGWSPEIDLIAGLKTLLPFM